MLATELEDYIGEGVVHANMATTHEMLCNLEETLVHQEKVQELLRFCTLRGNLCLIPSSLSPFLPSPGLAWSISLPSFPTSK